MSAPEWLSKLEKDGYVVVPNVIPREACDEFQNKALEWLENFPFGFKRDDRSTWDKQHLPASWNGLYGHYHVSHEDFVWKIRSRPEISAIFQSIWGTDDLISSFDAINISLPINAKTGRTDLEVTKPWPHIDQNPRTVQRYELYQGIANLAPNGPDDGGLVVMRGSHLLHQQFFDSIGGFRPEKDGGENENSYDYDIEELEWYKQHGCEIVKVCANAGDFILWDSRTMHWNASPVGKQTRFVVYACQAPRKLMTEEELAKKKQIFFNGTNTTHWPNKNIVPAEREWRTGKLPLKRPDGSLDQAFAERAAPLNQPKDDPAVLRLVGIRA